MEDKKIVITGGPCSGKSTLIKRLSDIGYKILSETAREVLSVYENKKDIIPLQKEIAKRQVEKERGLEGLCFLDRGVYDGLYYSEKFLGHVPREIEEIIPKGHKYDLILMPDLLPFEYDGLRQESTQAEAEEIHCGLERIYSKEGYDIVKIPVLPIEDRLKFVLSRIQNLKGGV